MSGASNKKTKKYVQQPGDFEHMLNVSVRKRPSFSSKVESNKNDFHDKRVPPKKSSADFQWGNAC